MNFCIDVVAGGRRLAVRMLHAPTLREYSHRRVEARDTRVVHSATRRAYGARFVRTAGADGIEQHAFLYPARAKGIKRKHFASPPSDSRCACRVHVGPLVVRGTWRPT